MILLTSASDLIYVTTATTSVLQAHASWVDLSGATVTPGRLNTSTIGAGTTTIVSSPGGATQRNVKTIFITNTSPTVTVSLVVSHTDGTNIVELGAFSLGPSYVLTWTEEQGWNCVNPLGQSSAASASFATSPLAWVAGIYGQIMPYGSIRTSPEPTTMISDNFNGTTIDTNIWNAMTSGGGTVVVANGDCTLSVGTTGSAYSMLMSNAAVTPQGIGFNLVECAVVLEAVNVNGCHRFWGQGTMPATFSTTTPLYDAIGFELDAAGNLYASCWTAGTRTQQALLTRPTDGGYHSYAVCWRADYAFFFLDGSEVPVTYFKYPQLSVNQLPLHAHVINQVAGVGSSPTFYFEAFGVADTARGGQAIQDGKYGWNKASVAAGSTVPLASAGQLVVTQSPSSGMEDMTGTARLSAAVPQLSGSINSNYGVQRVKIAIGDYGTDRGDVSNDGGRSLPIESSVERRVLELQRVKNIEQVVFLQTKRVSERQVSSTLARTTRDGRMY